MQACTSFSVTVPTDDPITTIGVQGAFHGANLPAARIEALIAAHVPRKEIADVADVYGSRWWDYRRLAPGHSFYLFAHCYYRGTKIAARKFVAEKARGNTPGDKQKRLAFAGPALVQTEVEDVWEKDKAHITGLWKAMLVADALGIPYPEFVRISCRVALERLWKRLPRPSQLYSDKLGAYVLDEWEELKKQRLFTATHPIYSVENYAALEVQDNYREWLIEQIKAQEQGAIVPLMTSVYARPQLPEALAAQHFPANAMNRARLLAA